MASKPLSDRRNRKEILRGVYEDNLRTTSDKVTFFGQHRGVRKEKHSPRAFITATLSASLALFILLAAALVATDHQTAQSAGPILADSAIAAPAKFDMLKEVIIPEDPSFQIDTPPSVANLYGLHLETIVIDAGHGGRDPGAMGQDGLYEKEVTMDIAVRLKKRLEQYHGYRVLLTRSDDRTMLLRDRIEFTNENEADLFVSIHVNWLPVDSIAPIETYYYGPNSDPRALRLAQRENRNSGYTVAEFNDLTQRLRVDLKSQESREAAEAIQEGLIAGLRTMGRDVDDWGIKSSDFMVLLGVEAPSILAEIGSLSNSDEESMLNTVSYREKLAYILEDGIASYLERHEHEGAYAKHGSEEESEGI